MGQPHDPANVFISTYANMVLIVYSVGNLLVTPLAI